MHKYERPLKVHVTHPMNIFLSIVTTSTTTTTTTTEEQTFIASVLSASHIVSIRRLSTKQNEKNGAMNEEKICKRS